MRFFIYSNLQTFPRASHRSAWPETSPYRACRKNRMFFHRVQHEKNLIRLQPCRRLDLLFLFSILSCLYLFLIVIFSVRWFWFSFSVWIEMVFSKDCSCGCWRQPSRDFLSRFALGGPGQKLLSTAVAAKVELLSIAFGMESGCLIYAHPADRVLGQFRCFHDHISSAQTHLFLGGSAGQQKVCC